MNIGSMSDNISVSSPLWLLLFFGLVIMVLDAFKVVKPLPLITAIGLLLSSVIAFPDFITPLERTAFIYNSIYFGGSASLVHIFLCISALLALFFIPDYLKRHDQPISETYALLIFSVIGMSMLANSNDLILVFIGLEIMSVCLYIMAGLFRKSVRSNEAGLKYFLLGAFTTGFLLYGIALIYGITGTTQLNQMNYAEMVMNPIFLPGFALILIGFLFKVSAFPFHNWTPDVYSGTPTPLAGFMATGSKLASFVALSFFLTNLLPAADGKVQNVLILLAVLSMIYGNYVAALQRNIKRMLAYSSIAHTGYVLLGIAAGRLGYLAALNYMIIYMVMTTGAFGIISMVENKDEDAESGRWQGIGLKYPALGIFMSVFLFSLAGMPPLAGFMGKYYVFSAAIEGGLVVPAVIGILTSVVGAFYYLRLIVTMYTAKPEQETQLSAPAAFPLSGAFFMAVTLLVLGLVPSIIYDLLDAYYQVEQLLTLAR
jgi:NADH-quinone oxidoreductase subunit N